MKMKLQKAHKMPTSKLPKIKKTKEDIQKTKKPKKELKVTPMVAAAVTKVSTVAQKKVPAVKRKTKASKVPPAVKSTGATLQVDPVAHKLVNTTAEQKDEPGKKVASRNRKSKKGKNEQKNVEQENGEQKTVEQNISIPEEETGTVATEATAETLALLPKQLISEASFKLLYEYIKKKAAAHKSANLFGDEMKYKLRIRLMKIPSCPPHIDQVILPHSLLNKVEDVCLIVPNLNRSSRQDHEDTIHHYQDKLRALQCREGIQVMAFNQMRKDHPTYEMKRKLMNRFELFLTDYSIRDHVNSFFGQKFVGHKKIAIGLKLDKDSTLKKQIDVALHTQQYFVPHKGRENLINFAAEWMPVEHAVENGMALIEKLKEVVLGGWLNIDDICMVPGPHNDLAFPVYMSTINPNLVPVPHKIGWQEAILKKENKRLYELTNGQYQMTADGLLEKVKPSDTNNEQTEETQSLDEIMQEDEEDNEDEDEGNEGEEDEEDDGNN